MKVDRLYHITSEPEAREAAKVGTYTPAAFGREGFIHCSYEPQVAAVANRLFRGKDDRVVLEIDPLLVGCPIVEENLEGGQELFPHIYGRLTMSAVVRVLPFHPDRDGFFEFPVKG